MRTILLAAAAMGLALTSASADCDYHKTVSAQEVDDTTVASVAPPSGPVVVTDEASKSTDAE